MQLSIIAQQQNTLKYSVGILSTELNKLLSFGKMMSFRSSQSQLRAIGRIILFFFIYCCMFLIVYYLLISIETIFKRSILRVARSFCGFNFCDSWYFFSDPGKNKFPKIKMIANIFAAKIQSRVTIFQFNFATQKYNTETSCLFNYDLSLLFRNN